MSERLTLQDLTDLLAEKQGVTKKDAEAFLRELIAIISESVEQNNSVKIKDFGTFKLVKVNSRKSVDVNTGEAIEIPAHYKLSFAPDKLLRDTLNAPFAHFESVVIEDGVDFEAAKAQIAGQQPPVDEEEDDIDTDETLVEEVEEEVKNNIIEPVVEDNIPQEVVDEKPQTQVELEKAKPEQKMVAEQELPKEEFTAEVQPEKIKEEMEVETQSEAEDMKETVLSEDLLQKVDAETNESEEETKGEEDDDDEEDEEMEWEDNSKTKWIIIGALFLAIIGICLYIYRDDFFGNKKIEETAIQANPIGDDKSAAILDSLAAVHAADSVAAINAEATKEVAEGQVKKDYKPKAVVKLKNGETLRLLALKHYGDKTFWVYIYEENKEGIRDFNYVQAGKTIVIPAAEKYGIDVSDSKSLAKAKVLEDKYFAK